MLLWDLQQKHGFSSSTFLAHTLKMKKYDTTGFNFTPSGLGIKITHEGDGNGLKPKYGQKVEAHYTGYLEDGKKFDSSVDRKQTFEFNVGKKQVIAGWDEGFASLKKGQKAVLYIPPALGYGERGAGRVIPPNSVLIFEVELVDIK